MTVAIARRWWPLVLVGLGALAMLVFGDLPQSVAGSQQGQAAWVLPASSAADVAESEQAWAEHQPWGSGTVPGDVSSGSDAKIQARAVGVVQGAHGLQAIFEVPGQPLARVQEGEGLPGGGVVSRISPRRVDWTTPEGESKSRLLLTDPLPASE